MKYTNNGALRLQSMCGIYIVAGNIHEAWNGLATRWVETEIQVEVPPGKVLLITGTPGLAKNDWLVHTRFLSEEGAWVNVEVAVTNLRSRRRFLTETELFELCLLQGG